MEYVKKKHNDNVIWDDKIKKISKLRRQLSTQNE
jgi:hypothetical protein